jgi:hypothetical protein
MYFVHKHIKIHHLLTNIISHINIPCIHICYCLLLFVITSQFHVFAGDIFVFADESCYHWRSIFSLAFQHFCWHSIFSLVSFRYRWRMYISLAPFHFTGILLWKFFNIAGDITVSLAIFLYRWRFSLYANNIHDVADDRCTSLTLNLQLLICNSTIWLQNVN